MPALEPSLAAPPPVAAKYFLATRPAFLSVTLAGCLIGLATAFADGVPLRGMAALVTIVFAMVAHASANVLNDYYDSRSGNDAANVERIFPFTGGSRFIQNGLLTEAQTLALGMWLIGATIAAGLWLMTASAPGLFFFGVAGLFVGWAYSAPPLALNSRGWGEACIWAAWMIVAAGTDYVQRAAPSPHAWVASAGYAALVMNLLFVNQFPDRKADEMAGKRHWVVRLGPERAARMYPVIAYLAHGVLLAAVLMRSLPPLALAGLASLPLSLKAAAVLKAHAATPAKLAPAIQATIGAALVHGVLVAAGIAASRLF